MIALSMVTGLFAQTKNIVVTLGNNSTAYDDLNEAIKAAPNGATIYVPGGTHSVSDYDNDSKKVIDLTISKQLHFRGNGIFPNSLANGKISVITGKSIYLQRASNGSTFEGIEFQNYIHLDHKAIDTSGSFVLTFNRCYIYNSIDSNVNGISNLIKNITMNFNECVLADIWGTSSVETVNINNSILDGRSTIRQIKDIDQVTITNCIILTSLAGSMSNISINNSIITGYINTDMTSCSLKNCLLPADKTIPANYPAQNIIYQNPINYFVNVILTNGIYCPYAKGYDYHLKAGCLGIGAGTDGKDLGIYGGNSPWKEQGIPAAPNVYQSNVDTHNDATGKINASYKVKAQNY